MKHHLTLSLLAAGSTLSLTTSQSRAVGVTYTIVPGASTLVISGSFGGAPFLPQSPGALFTDYAGTISGDLVGSTLTFSPGGSSISAMLNPAAILSGGFSPPGTGTDNYGVTSAIPGSFGAFRDIEFDIPVGFVTDGALPATSGMEFEPGSHLDYFVPPLAPPAGTVPLDLATAISINSAPGLVDISITGLVETLTLPVSISFSIPGGSVQSFDGFITATRPVPEPGTLWLSLLAGSAVLRRRRS